MSESRPSTGRPPSSRLGQRPSVGFDEPDGFSDGNHGCELKYHPAHDLIIIYRNLFTFWCPTLGLSACWGGFAAVNIVPTKEMLYTLCGSGTVKSKDNPPERMLAKLTHLPMDNRGLTKIANLAMCTG
eukprot:8386746-Pyramimonas_sp.AAC.1